jgi:hypothetical protein
LRHDLSGQRKRERAVRPHEHLPLQIRLLPDRDIEPVARIDAIAGLVGARHRILLLRPRRHDDQEEQGNQFDNNRSHGIHVFFSVFVQRTYGRQTAHEGDNHWRLVTEDGFTPM